MKILTERSAIVPLGLGVLAQGGYMLSRGLTLAEVEEAIASLLNKGLIEVIGFRDGMPIYQAIQYRDGTTAPLAAMAGTSAAQADAKTPTGCRRKQRKALRGSL